MIRLFNKEIQKKADGLLIQTLSFWAIDDQNTQEDIGTDFEVKVFTKELDKPHANSISTGLTFKIQNKGKETLKKLENGTISLQVPKKNIRYWCDEITIPVIISVCDVTNNKIYWHPIQIDETIDNKLSDNPSSDSIQIHINPDNVLQANNINKIVKDVNHSLGKISVREIYKTDYLQNFRKLSESKDLINIQKSLQLLEVGDIAALFENFENNKEKIITKLSSILIDCNDSELRYRAIDLKILYELHISNESRYEFVRKYLPELRKSAKKLGNYYRIDYLWKLKISELITNLSEFEKLEQFYPIDDRAAKVHLKIAINIRQLSYIRHQAELKKQIIPIGLDAVIIAINLTDYFIFIAHFKEFRQLIIEIRQQVKKMLVYSLGLARYLISKKKEKNVAIAPLADEPIYFDLFTFLLVNKTDFPKLYDNRMEMLKQIYGDNEELFQESKLFIDNEIDNLKLGIRIGHYIDKFKLQGQYAETK